MEMHLGFKLDIMDITRISYLDITADSFPGYRTWIIKDISGYKWDNCVGPLSDSNMDIYCGYIPGYKWI